MNERQDNCTVRMQEVAKVDDFKYRDLTVQSNGVCGREVKKEYRKDGMIGEECQE